MSVHRKVRLNFNLDFHWKHTIPNSFLVLSASRVAGGTLFRLRRQMQNAESNEKAIAESGTERV
jgi:hypothetical protein